MLQQHEPWLVGIASKVQAERLLAGSLHSSSWRLAGRKPGSGKLAQLEALQWTPRLSAALTREERAAA